MRNKAAKAVMKEMKDELKGIKYTPRKLPPPWACKNEYGIPTTDAILTILVRLSIIATVIIFTSIAMNWTIVTICAVIFYWALLTYMMMNPHIKTVIRGSSKSLTSHIEKSGSIVMEWENFSNLGIYEEPITNLVKFMTKNGIIERTWWKFDFVDFPVAMIVIWAEDVVKVIAEHWNDEEYMKIESDLIWAIFNYAKTRLGDDFPDIFIGQSLDFVNKNPVSASHFMKAVLYAALIEDFSPDRDKPDYVKKDHPQRVRYCMATGLYDDEFIENWCENNQPSDAFMIIDKDITHDGHPISTEEVDKIIADCINKRFKDAMVRHIDPEILHKLKW